jgi:hypothetical protein
MYSDSLDMNQIQIRLTFIGQTLSGIEIAIQGAKGPLTISLEHPALYLFKLLNEARQHAETKTIQLASNISEESAPELTTGDIANAPVCIVPLANDASAADDKPIKLWSSRHLDKFSDLLQRVEEGLAIHKPELCEEGVNGTYFLKDVNGDFIGVFKPEDEEINSSNNPKSSEEKKESFGALKAGEAAKREVAAYLLDREGFFGVPRTSMVDIKHSSFSSMKTGSLQEFVPNDGSCWDIGPSVFPVREVHKIGILDIYMLNFDRHGGNILFREEEDRSYSLIPIDNGFSLPDTVYIPSLWFEWLNWPQAKKHFDEETKAFIERLDPEADAAMLKQELGIREECLRVLKISAKLLKMCAANNLTLYDIGKIICRGDPETPSDLEQIYSVAQEANNEEESLLQSCQSGIAACITKRSIVQTMAQ